MTFLKQRGLGGCDMDIEQQKQPQSYDSSLKALVQQQASDILPLLLPGAVYEETLNVEIIRPAMRADKVYRVGYRDREHILHLEFESGADSHMCSRLLAYNSMLYLDHHLPVISMIIYPFRTKMAESPLLVMSGEEAIVTFNFLKLPLFLQDAEYYVREHVSCMYPLLPAMRNVDHKLMQRVMDELKELYRDDEVTLAQQLVWMELLLARTDTVPIQEKEKIRRNIKMYDPLWEEHPKVQQIRAESEAKGEERGKKEGEAKGKAEGIVQGELLALRRLLVSVVKTRFPALIEVAQREAGQIKDPEVLDLLIQKLIATQDELAACWLLTVRDFERS